MTGERTARGRVLLAAGGSEDRRHLGRGLADLGLWVRTEPDGAAALDALTTGRFDLAVLDADLPALDAVGVLDMVRADPATADLMVVVTCDGPQAEEVLLRCLEMGADDVLAAPYDPYRLRALVATALARSWLRERERECHDQVARLAAALGDGPLADDPMRADGRTDPFASLSRTLTRLAEQVSEHEHGLRRRHPSAGPPCPR